MSNPMRSGQRTPVVLSLLALTAGVLLPACSGGGGGGGGGFKIVGINLNEGTVWRINRQIEIAFSEPVDFNSVSLNTVNVRQVGGGPAAGEFYLTNGDRTVVFQPLCPTRDDLSDAGLHAGTNPNDNDLPYAYELNIIGADKNSALPVRAASGDALSLSQTRRFTTPVSLNPLNLYLDTKVGPPIARVIGDQLDTDTSNGTYVEVGGAQGQKHYFERIGGVLTINPPLDLPLNKSSDPDSQVALIVNFDQAVNPNSLNIASDRLRWEFQNSAGAWVALSTEVTLETNCARSGSRVRITPLGVLPPSTNMRAVVTPEFLDIVGEVNAVAQNNFAVASTEAFPVDPPLLTDHVLEDFDTSDQEDANVLFAEPHAEWGNGVLRSRFSFSGTGGPGGNFDWYIPTGAIVVFNTSNTTITGYALTLDGSNNVTSYQATAAQTIVGGVVDVDDFYVDTGATLKIEGPNAFNLMVAGKATIRGRINISGTSTDGVGSLNTTMLPEPGAAGQAGGGKGGTGSPLTTASSPKGGDGYGAWNVANLGGGGGETGWSTGSAQNSRRGAGGGGGQMGPSILAATAGVGTYDQRRIGFDAEPGFDNLAGDNGAFSGALGPLGGSIGPSPFGDPNPSNNHFGTMFDNATAALIVGELSRPWAGAGGGAGGDAAKVPANPGTFPGPWDPLGDEKGAGGGGGGGSFHLMALGTITFGVAGQIQCRGGLGGGGENTLYLNRVGGGSGGGSGGHVVLQSASIIDFSARTGVVWNSPNDNSFAIDCRGGEGGAGAQDLGGAFQSVNGQIEYQPLQDACPTSPAFGGPYPTTGPNGCKGQVDGAGGDGGPGLIQLHTSTGNVGLLAAGADIVLPANGATLRDLCAPAPLSATNTAASPTNHMIPTFGRTSRALSKWYALGEGGFDPSSPTYKDVSFAFLGTDPATGFVQTTGGQVTGVAPVLGPTVIDLTGAATPYVVTPGGYQVVIDASPLVDTNAEVLLLSPDLLLHYAVELTTGVAVQRYDVVDASYDSGTQRLTLTVDGDGPSMLSFNLTVGTTVALRPAYFRVRSSGTADYLPSSATVRIRIEATSADSLGQPDLGAATGLQTDIALLNAQPNGTLRFIRFEVLFDIAAQGGALSPLNAIPSLEFFRLPFTY